jgi:arylamine N-acetyltransferase
MVDIEVSNWFVSTHPDSPFVSGVIVSRRPQDGSIEILSDWSGEPVLVTETPEGSTSVPVARAELPELIASRFDLGAAPQPRM